MEYEINKNTQVLLPISETKSKVIEKDNEYIVNNSVFKIIEHSCEYFGSTYEGRKNGTKKLLGISYKSPIIIEDYNNLIFFPTTSPESEECIWINREVNSCYCFYTNESSPENFLRVETSMTMPV